VRRARAVIGSGPRIVTAAVAGALLLGACGGSSSTKSSSAKHAAESPAKAACNNAAKAAMASFLGIQPEQISSSEATGASGNPECTYTEGTGRHRVKLLADYYTGPQPYFILERTAIEASQVFVPTRTVPPPQAVNMGLEADWFPAREQLMVTDGLRLVTTTVIWNRTTQKRRLALAKAFTKPYIKVTAAGRAAVKGYP
jgi:hypothetical protein